MNFSRLSQNKKGIYFHKIYNLERFLDTMKFLLEIVVPNEVGNQKLKDGSMMKHLHKYLGEVKPEKVYFGIAHGKRTLFMVIDVPSAEKLPELLEPLWIDFQAEIFITPVMDAHEFEKASLGIERVVKERM